MGHSVSLLRCKSYDIDCLVDAFAKALDLIGFDSKGIRAKTVLLKPNMLGAYPPEMGVTTPPAFVEAAIIFFKDLGCTVWVGDSPNGIFPVDCVWERTGIHSVCKKHGVIEKIFEREGGVLRDGILIAKPVLEAELLVNLPKLKTHGLTVMTAATKNLFGCVPGLQKTSYHRIAKDRFAFAKILVNVAEIARPSINLVDAITAMEGTGPSGGKLLQMDTIITGTNHHSVDAVCADLIGITPLDVDTLYAAHELGAWNSSDHITILGETIEACRPKSFELPTTFTRGLRDWWISRFVVNRIWDILSIKPKINKKKCKRCGLCIKACPVDAIEAPRHMHEFMAGCEQTPMEDMKKPAPHVINKLCVMCYCCHEICPYQAIDLRESWGIRLGRLLGERQIRRRNGDSL